MSQLEGILNVDKPAGMTSHDVVSRVRRVAQMRRVGHAGTLDPLATGVLLLCLGRATRLAEYLIGHAKSYAATIRLGQETNTYDADGAILAERPFSQLTHNQIEQALTTFRGPIQQRPPMYSAVKKDGQPLYKLARRGQEVERPHRAVTIFRLDLIDWQPPHLTLQVTCSSGTYIRSLAHDLGQILDCGGHVTALRRTAISQFKVETAVSLHALTPENIEEHVQATDTAVAHLPRLELSMEDTAALRLGQRIDRADLQAADELARAYAPGGQFIGLVVNKGATWQPKKIFHP